jgi:hypothetical protein
MHWCEQVMIFLGIASKPTASTFLTPNGPIIPIWYEPLLFRVRAHVASKQEPLLQLAPKFDDDSGDLKATRQRLEQLQARQYDLLPVQEQV